MRVLRRYEDPAVGSVGTRDADYVAAGYAGWSVADLLAAVAGGALALIGLIALVRAGVDDTWFTPVTQVIDANHTALLGALEIGAGVLLILAAAGRSRSLAALVGIAMVIGGVFAAVQTGDVSRQLAIEDWWAWTLAAGGGVVALTALLPSPRSAAV